MTQFEIDSFVGASGGGGGVVSGAYQLSGIYQVSGDYAFDFAKQVSGLYVTHSGGFYTPSGAAGGGGGTVSGWAQASGLYVEHSGGLYQPSGVYVGASGGLYQASGIFQASGVFQTSGIYQVSGDYPLAHTKQASGIYLLTSGGLYQVSGIYPTSGLFALSGTGGAGGAGVSGVVHAATFLGSGNNSTLLYTLSHGLGRVPTGISVDAGSPQARGDIDVSGNASGIFVTYTSPPLSGDVKLSWIAGPSDAANIVTLGSGTVHAATFVGSGNASTTTYTLSHGIGTVPQGLVVSPLSPNARGDFDVSGNASGIFVTYPIAPASGDVKLSWLAGPSTLVAISGNLVHGAEFIGSGNNSTTQYTLSHGLGNAPNTILVKEGSPQARGHFDVSGNASGIFVTYTSPPASGTVRLFWQAGPTSIATLNAQSGIYTITSGSTLQGIISGISTLAGTVNISGKISGMPRLHTSYVVYKDEGDTLYKLRDGTTWDILGSNAAIDPCIVSGLALLGSGTRNIARGGSIFIQRGTHTLSSGFNQFNVPEHTEVKLENGCFLVVPNGFSGIVFNMQDFSGFGSVGNMIVGGPGTIKEAGTPQRLWTGVRLYSSLVGLGRCLVGGGLHLINPGIGIELKTDTSGWMNGNGIKDVWMTGPPTIGVQFTNTLSVTDGYGPNRNLFEDIYMQMASGAQYGFKDINGKQNVFLECRVFDMNNSGQVTANIVSGSKDNIIIGGTMTAFNFDDQGTDTKTINEDFGFGTIQTPKITPYSGNIIEFAQNYSGLSMNINMIPGNDTLGTSFALLNKAQNERLQVSKTPSFYDFNSQRISESGVIRTMRWKVTDSFVGTILEGMEITASGNVEFNRSGGTVQFNSGNTSTTATAQSGTFFSGTRPIGFITARLGTSAIKIPYFNT